MQSKKQNDKSSNSMALVRRGGLVLGQQRQVDEVSRAMNTNWGLKTPNRPQTPSEGRAMAYSRVGRKEQQQMYTHSNGTTVEFGLEDLVNDPAPGGPFDNQFLAVDSAVLDIKLSRRIHEPSKNDPFNNFRERQLPLNEFQVRQWKQRYGDYVPSKYAKIDNTPSMYNMTNKADIIGTSFQHDVDTRFGVLDPEVKKDIDKARREKLYGNSGRTNRSMRHAKRTISHFASILPDNTPTGPRQQQRMNDRDAWAAELVRDPKAEFTNNSITNDSPSSSPPSPTELSSSNLYPNTIGGQQFQTSNADPPYLPYHRVPRPSIDNGHQNMQPLLSRVSSRLQNQAMSANSSMLILTSAAHSDSGTRFPGNQHRNVGLTSNYPIPYRANPREQRVTIPSGQPLQNRQPIRPSPSTGFDLERLPGARSAIRSQNMQVSAYGNDSRVSIQDPTSASYPALQNLGDTSYRSNLVPPGSFGQSQLRDARVERVRDDRPPNKYRNYRKYLIRRVTTFTQKRVESADLTREERIPDLGVIGDGRNIFQIR